MRYLALASDYDGTLAHDGIVAPETLDSLNKVRNSGRKLLLVTGRQVGDLIDTFPHLEYFDSVVAENGALLYNPATQAEKVLAEAPSAKFVAALRDCGVEPLAVGRVIVATWDSQKDKVLDVVHNQGVECQLIFNKGALMVLPSGVNKATGLKAALDELCLGLHNTVGVGDAENDHAFLSVCECSVAVSNALPSLKERADFVTKGPRGAGVGELIDQLLEDDLASRANRLSRHDILLGTLDGNPEELRIPVYGPSLLLAGTSGGGKSTLTTGIMERLSAAEYQFCALDPEGDYQSFPGALVIGDTKHAPSVSEIIDLLEKPGQSVIVNLLGVSLEHRPDFFYRLFPRIQELRARTGRPHWIILDEAHHLLPAERDQAVSMIPKELTSILFVTLEPDHMPSHVIELVDSIIAVGRAPANTIRKFCEVHAESCPRVPPEPLEKGAAMLWSRTGGGAPIRFHVVPSSIVIARHSRKYAAAELSPDRSFYFRGPEGKLNLRVQNLMLFLQTMDGVDDETWLFHFRQGEYSHWFREAIKSNELADAAEQVETQADLSASESRARMRAEIELRYTLPA